MKIVSTEYTRFIMPSPHEVVDHLGKTAIEKRVEELTIWGARRAYVDPHNGWMVYAGGNYHFLENHRYPNGGNKYLPYALDVTRPCTFIVEASTSEEILGCVYASIEPLLSHKNKAYLLLSSPLGETGSAWEYTLYKLALSDQALPSYVTFGEYDNSPESLVKVYDSGKIEPRHKGTRGAGSTARFFGITQEDIDKYGSQGNPLQEYLDEEKRRLNIARDNGEE